MGKSKGSEEYDAWNPGLESRIPREVLRLSTMFCEETVETGFDEAHELADFSGLKPIEVATFRPERLIVHELLIRVTSDLSVPDGPNYEELGINLRNITAVIYDKHIFGNLDDLIAGHEKLRVNTTARIGKLLDQRRRQSSAPVKQRPEPNGAIRRVLGLIFSKDLDNAGSEGDSLELIATESQTTDDPELEQSCRDALDRVAQSVISHRGSLVGDHDTLVKLATGVVLNTLGSRRLGAAIEPIIQDAVNAEGYRFLPAQEKPLILNVKGASAAGKSTIRPEQRALATKLGIAWEDFALISPDYWRKYLLEYESLGDPYKYGAMLTGHELEIVDKKLDRYMAQKAEAGTMPHLLVDRFRFDSFQVGDDKSSQLLTRFGDTAYLFFMITPPEETVERAWKRGLMTGRYKAVEDLLDHNIEAYTGMPALFFSWALSSKQVHYEFLDNDVAFGEKPKTVAFGWNGAITILDVAKLIDIERYKRVDVDATSAEEVFRETDLSAEANCGFLKQCAEMMETITFANQQSGHIYGVLKDGEWALCDSTYVANYITDVDTLAGLEMLGWEGVQLGDSKRGKVSPECSDTLGQWA